MAEKDKKEDVKEAKPAAGGNNKLLLVVIVLLVLVLAAVGGLAAYVFLSNKSAGADASHATAEHAPEKKEKKEGPPVFEKLEPFVVNLSGGSSMLQIELQAELYDEAAKNNMKAYLPKIRSALILLLSAKTEEELQSADGKIKLKAQIKKIINESMDAGEEEPVENVLFTSFIIQLQ
ncbi:flagellar basal body-associated FliL family protein [Vogesella indigofera]|uniref:flagellar basal body-associated FliL family protein n=1 Tax=Vogesella indigofera TaxID=45465 RepID=UPI00234E3B4F|nr:flagellar basal body-associated FliL family protein [Vogesella indigofera]MDC7699791.1 flagellar basal body-associated FliL family protein [Vogesella indigofera]